MQTNIFQLTTGEKDEKEFLLREADAIRQSPSIHWLPFGFKFLKECRGCFFLSCITTMWAYNSYFIPSLVLIPMHREEHIGVWVIWVFMFLSCATIICLVRSCLSNPGYIPFDIRPTSLDHIHWSHCKKCLIQRPLKSHHCSRCKRCVRRMDHHCPWINSCVGEDNQFVFVLLLLYGFLLSSTALLLDGLHFYYFPSCSTCDMSLFRFRYERYLMYGCFVSGCMLEFFCFTQLFSQIYNISKDKTTVESLIYGGKPVYERPVNTKKPMDSFRDVFGRGHILFWLNPLRTRQARNIIVYAEVA
ncbi:palmitoyltransferase ZDHHC21-like [Lytechinus pictus]|uniref:palmitoyltransferase ZDHHC21-like n=1 Tax=Lytechinus pictus TaxID=7653 RepID=UPI0030B9E08E